MAARENQGLQIALIIFVMLTIVLSVTTFMFFRKFEEAELKEKAANVKREEALKKQTNDQEEAIVLKKILGAGTRDSLKSIEDNAKEDIKTIKEVMKTVKKDMETVKEDIKISDFADTDPNYRYMVKYLHTELVDCNTLFVDVKQLEEQLKAKLANEEKIKLAEIARVNGEFDKSVTDLKAERVSFNNDRETFKDSLGGHVKTIDKDRRSADDDKKKLVEENQALARQVETLAIKLKTATDKIWDKEKFADAPRGKITWVDQRSRVVWLNVGAADGLRRQITFKVLAAEETNLVDAKKKGSIEVTRVVDKHLAEARILDDDLSNPIVPGDQIFSKVWVPGRVEHFALAGFLDIDGDHESDRRRIHNLISVNGGIIDAEVGDDGKRSGEMSLNTHYLIMGTRPTDKSAAAELKSYADMLREAGDLGVQKISLEEFLDNVGYQPEHQTVSLEAAAQTGDFRAKPLGDGAPRQSNSPFKARRPPTSATAKPSAY